MIYSRKNVLCGLCGERLPADLLFTPEEREKVEKDMKVLKERERKMHEAEAERHKFGSSPYYGKV